MCGIVGIFDLRDRRPIDRELLTSMNETQVHRGPDGSGMHIEPGLGLGHRRLSIIDLAAGKQPLFNEDGSVAVTYNGEIYNFAGLAKELIDHGHQFKTRCDTEVIVHAWEQWGEASVERFGGMFAFAVWDRKRRSLFLARDRIGIKPLYYATTPDGYFIFGSELKALLCHPSLPRNILPQSVEDYLTFGYVPDPKTILAHVHKLAPGHSLLVADGKVREPKRYWDVPFGPRATANAEDLQNELVDRLRASVESHCISDVPLGAFLSGGVDSSAVVALMSGLSSEPVNSCSISFGNPEFNEAPYADMVATRYRTAHRSAQVEADDFDLVDRLAALYDEPFADSSAMPTYRVSELARKNVTVALSGDGGDENFAGYRRYRWHLYEERVRRALPRFIRAPLFGFAGRVYPKLDWAPAIVRAKSTLQAIARDSLEAYLHTVSVSSDEARRELLSADFDRQLQGYRSMEVFRAHAANAPTEHPLSLAQYLDFKTYLPGDILTKVDRASMAHGLEVRVPLLDHGFVEWASTLPPELKLSGREGKYIFKKAMERFLPQDVLYRPKMGFAVPLSSWFRGPLRQRVRDTLLGAPLQAVGMFDGRYVARIVDEHERGERNHSTIIWALIMLAGSFRTLLDVPRTAARAELRAG